jgi:hypothetical protein
MRSRKAVNPTVLYPMASQSYTHIQSHKKSQEMSEDGKTESQLRLLRQLIRRPILKRDPIKAKERLALALVMVMEKIVGMNAEMEEGVVIPATRTTAELEVAKFPEQV